MHDIYVFLVVITFFLLVITGATIAIRNYSSKVHLSFFAFCLFTACWLISNFFSNDLSLENSALIATNHLVLSFGALSLASLASFTYFFTRQFRKRTFLAIFSITTISSLLALTPLVVDKIKPSEQAVEIIFGPLSGFYFLSLIAAMVYSAAVLISKYIHSTGNDRKKVKYIIVSIILTCLISLLTNILGPILGYFDLTTLGSLSTIIIVFGTAYAVIFDQMFEFHNFFWRFIVYLLSIALVALILSALLVLGVSVFFRESPLTLIQVIYIIIIFIPLAIIFHPIKEFIKKVTNKYLFQQDYIIQESLDNLSNISSKSIDTKKIQKSSLNILSETIRQQYGIFILTSTVSKNGYILGERKGPIPPSLEQMLPQLIKILNTSRKKVITLTDLKEDSVLKKYFDLFSIGCIIPLSSRDKLLGYIILGEKISGAPYVKKDKDFLSITSHDMTLAISNAQHYEEIQQFNDTLKQKVSEATAALKRTNSKLMALDDAKDEFISMASHQMRTPLTSVKGYISMLLEEDLGKLNKAQKQALKEAFDSSQRMVFLISDFLNVSRIRTGRFMIEPSVMSMPEVVKQEISQLRDMAAYKEQKIQYMDPQDFPLVSLDENKVRQVMMNMIDNAMYYTPKGGVIDIILEKTDKEIVFKVVDSGIGVPAKEQHRLFTKFFRAANARRARPDGTGLGLFMAQKIITAQKGRIIFNSEENKGSTFGFRFPLKDIEIDNKSQKD